MEWVTREADDNDNLPTEAGLYRVMITGDAEYIDGHCIYSFDDYASWAYFTPHEDGGNFSGDGDEENYNIFAYYGPIPEYKAP